MPARTVELQCPACHESDALSTLERLEGLVEGGAYAEVEMVAGYGRVTTTVRKRAFVGDRTEVLWDSSKTVALYCRSCNWQSSPIESKSDYDHALAELEEPEEAW